jgi:hypothetical protein
MSTTGVISSLGEWMVKRGILYGLISTPITALFIGYFYRWTSFPIATAFTVLLAFAILPAWVVARRYRSTDPDEPVHHLHRYALWALIPYVVYNIARVPMHYLLQIVFWDHWYDYGYELTGFPVDQWGSLFPGTLLHSLQGYVLTLGFYILYKRHTLLNALAYVWIFLSTIYTWTFPTFVLVDFQPPAKWFFVVWWAHFWMALAAWYVPIGLYSPTFWNRFRTGWARALMLIVIILIYIFPISFVFWRVATWQFPFQREIDQATFEQAQLVLKDQPTLATIDSVADQATAQEARYTFTLNFGPRPYRDYINALKALDAGPVNVTGRLMHNGQVIAWCSGFVGMMETPNNILTPGKYFPEVERLKFTDVPVNCIGPADAVQQLGITAGGEAQVDLQWLANVTLIGDREQMEKQYEGNHLGVSLHVDDKVLSQVAQR